MSASYPAYCLLGEQTVLAWYEQQVADGVLEANARQREAVAVLQALADTMTDEVAAGRGDGGAVEKSGWLRRLTKWVSQTPAVVTDSAAAEKSLTENSATAVTNSAAEKSAVATKSAAEKMPFTHRGLYIHGGVGVGKSLLMDSFYLQLPIARKLRVHFHEFMRRLHSDMKAMDAQSDPLLRVCEKLNAKYDIICFDEFHISDIADAMLLARLLEILLGGGVRFVMTSNYAPAGLYPNGLARDRFLPAIALIEKQMQVFAFGGQEDYRQKHLAQRQAYFSPADNIAQAQLQLIYTMLSCGIDIADSIRLSGRTVPVVRRGPDCIWFDFATLCQSERSQADYLQLARRFATVLLSDVPRLDGADIGEAARRFTWLVDIFYDARVKLIMSARAPLEKLYGDGDGGESGRTLSRLYEMQQAKFAAAG